ncbi:MAG: hypothetical protein M5U12_27020 [Verrucomicrobia bacterium]|nr:hypothetical protein [Verrucomicrobiota bacterium]
MFLSRWIGRGRSWRQVSGSAARCRWLPCAAFGLTALWGVPAAQAVIFYSSGDAAKNTTAPAGELADSGWQYQGYWLNYTGTPVGPFHFLTAKHVGGKVGNIFTWQGVAYTATAKIAHPQADLVLWQVDQPFPFWADLHTGKDEVGKELVVFGRGRRRGGGGECAGRERRRTPGLVLGVERREAPLGTECGDGGGGGRGRGHPDAVRDL